MAGLGLSTGLPCCRRTSRLLVKPSSGGITPGKSLRTRISVVRADINFVNANEAKELVETQGYTVLDVRDKTQFERAHIKTCHHVPVYIENDDNDIGTIVKRTVHNNFSGLFFGIPFTKPNADFVPSVKEKFSAESKLLLVCQEGLRSAAAANKLEQAGTFDSVGSSELQNAGKAGLVTVQGKISAVLGTVLVCAFLFITFFPDQAEKILQLAPGS